LTVADKLAGAAGASAATTDDENAVAFVNCDHATMVNGAGRDWVGDGAVGDDGDPVQAANAAATRNADR
jgi:hypothetical protein